MEKLFKKGDKVIITREGMNDTSSNSEQNLLVRGYIDLNWKNETFTIEGSVQLNRYPDDDVQCSYLLTLNNKIVGYVYNTALELAPQVLHITHMWSEKLGKWINQPGEIALYSAKASLIANGIYSAYWSDGVHRLYKGKIK